MKLLIASDIHGSAYWCGRLMEEIEKENPDRVILLGDLLYHGPRNDLPRDYAPKQVIPMLSGIKEKIVAVRGNCEAEVDQMVLPFPCLADYAELLVDGTLFHLSHGHHQNPENLPPLPDGKGKVLRIRGEYKDAEGPNGTVNNPNATPKPKEEESHEE